jgi:CRISPR system Cascade subunit CasE
MYLSKLELNLRSKNVRRDLADCYQMHRSIYNCFPSKDEGGAGAIVYRVENYNSPVQNRSPVQTVLVVSEKKPSWEKLTDRYLEDSHSLAYSEKLKAVTKGGFFRFLLKANPTKKVQGKRIPLRSYEERLKWIERKSENHGFRLLDLSIRSESALTSNSKDEHKMTFNSVFYEGYLSVTDDDLFKKALFFGIGSAKAFGFGLLTIAR